MRIKRTDRDFTVRQKADRKIHYAGQGKKYTENNANFSPKEKQDAVRQKHLLGQVQEYRYRADPILSWMQGIFLQMKQQNPISRRMGMQVGSGTEIMRH